VFVIKFIIKFLKIKAIETWEAITDLIVNREKNLYDLEVFETNASDPNRFFLKST
jgi:hypothetical protein